MSYPDWQEPHRLVRESLCPPTEEQWELSRRYAVPLQPEMPRRVAAAVLTEGLGPRIGTDRPRRKATPKQRGYLADLSRDRNLPAPETLSRLVASAWIAALLAEHTLAGLERLQPCRGDLVYYPLRRDYWIDEGEPGAYRSEVHVVRSIGASGRVNFHYQRRRFSRDATAAWPNQLFPVADAELWDGTAADLGSTPYS